MAKKFKKEEIAEIVVRWGMLASIKDALKRNKSHDVDNRMLIAMRLYLIFCYTYGMKMPLTVVKRFHWITVTEMF